MKMVYIMLVNILGGQINKERKIIFFDVDGTLYTPDLGGISKNVKNAIRQTRSQGHLCFISEANTTCYARGEVLALAL